MPLSKKSTSRAGGNRNKKIFVGLGNPGAEFENTYHNVGFLMLDKIVGHKKLLMGVKKLFAYAITDDAIFVKPLTFMNTSGTAAHAAMRTFGVPLRNLIVIHDDSDLTIGNFKISFGKNSGGHKGVQSIIDVLGSNQFFRIRIGIRREREIKRQKAGEFALKTITPNHHKILLEVFAKISELAITASLPSAKT